MCCEAAIAASIITNTLGWSTYCSKYESDTAGQMRAALSHRFANGVDVQKKDKIDCILYQMHTPIAMIQALYQALQISVSLGKCI